jgi:hypothetical protein
LEDPITVEVPGFDVPGVDLASKSVISRGVLVQSLGHRDSRINDLFSWTPLPTLDGLPAVHGVTAGFRILPEDVRACNWEVDIANDLLVLEWRRTLRFVTPLLSLSQLAIEFIFFFCIYLAVKMIRICP